jgi:2-polyprenyl-6-methoxyphenol hydroxylase-like FAD-dependent oxidoreductase
MSRIARVAVVGAGLAGLAVSVAAAAAGVTVDLFDASEGLAAPRSHIDVVPNMVRELAAIGLAEECVRRGFVYRDMAVVDADGHLVHLIPSPALAGPRLPAAFGMVYAELLELLLARTRQLGVGVHWKTRIVRAEIQGGSARLWLEGRAEWRGDLVILAGATLVGGVELPLADHAESLRQRWDYVLLPRPQEIERSTWVIGPASSKALIVPVGVAQIGLACLQSQGTDDLSVIGTASDLRTRLGRSGRLLASLAASLRDDTTVLSRHVRFGLLKTPWHDGAALRIGSSAHMLPPHFGQAAAQSLEDATVLGALLRRPIDRDDLLGAFEARRADRAARVYAVAAQAARWDLKPEPSTDLPALALRLKPLVETPA